jgi:uncharacterized protein (TIGR03084 family)
MAIVIEDLCADLGRETNVLDACLASLDDDLWRTPTPAEGWTVLDQIVHLAFFDQMVTIAVTDPERFGRERDALIGGSAGLVATATAAGRGSTPGKLVERFAAGRTAMVDAFMHADPAARVPWYGPTMSVGSALTARIMETWAHGQDVFDAVGQRHPVTAALRQVAHIGVRALPNSFVTRGREVPTEPVYVRLEAPASDVWEWGPADAANRVTGTAEDFCLVVTQRRHIADTDLETEGEVAEEWMSIAQAFAGAAGTGREPGQFSRSG